MRICCSRFFSRRNEKKYGRYSKFQPTADQLRIQGKMGRIKEEIEKITKIMKKNLKRRKKAIVIARVVIIENYSE